MSELRADTITGSDGTSPVTLTKQSAAKQWVATGVNNISALDSLNTSSLTDLSGSAPNDYEVNFTNSMGNATYAVSTSGYATANRHSNHNNKATGKYEVNMYYTDTPVSSTSATADSSVLGDLA
jgi:hypothetical protein